tara:strand:- start:343 stop:2064 length:1722 start_codon:yes stop_codon:yes gene_type:complete
MSTKKISDLTPLTGANLVLADVLVVVDISSSETKSLKVEDLLSSSVFDKLPSNTIPIAKVNVSSQSIAGSAIANLGIDTGQIATDAVDATKLADNSASNLTSGLPTTGGFVGQIAVDSAASYAASIWDGSAWQSLKAPDAITTIASSNTALIDIVTTLSGSTATLAANIGDSTAPAQFVAGPTGESGTVTLRTISGTDLPVSTSTSLGAIKVNAEGLRLDAGVIEIDNDVTASSAFNLVSVTSKGLVSSYRTIESADLPDGTDSVKGALQVGAGLSVTNGVISLGNVVSGGTFTKAEFDNSGLFVSGSPLLGTDIPVHSADLLTSGTVAAARIGANTIGREKFTDTSICIFQSVAQTSLSSTSSAFKGEMLFDTETNELYLHDASAWRKVSGSGDSSSSSSGGGGLFSGYAMLVNKINSDEGGGGTHDSFNVRLFDTVLFDKNVNVTPNYSTGAFSLTGGTASSGTNYFIKCRGYFYRPTQGVGRLYNATDSSVALKGMIEHQDHDDVGSVTFPVTGRVNVPQNATKAFRYEQSHSYSSAELSNALGDWDQDSMGADSNGVSHNLEIEIWKEA